MFGFFFNHESKLRDGRFITRKIINKLKTTKQSKILEINNINDMIDWGHAEDYMNATLKIINLKKPSHHIIATGKNHSLKYFIELVCKFLNIR